MRAKTAGRGDTIVEVLIATLVISSILAGAFVSARKSQSAIRQSQERVEALNVAEGQIERVKSLAQGNDAQLDTTVGKVFCVYDVSDSSRVQLLGSIPELAADDFAHEVYGDNCAFTPNAGVTYYAHITRDAQNTFIVRVRWDGVNGIGKQETMLALRVDQL